MRRFLVLALAGAVLAGAPALAATKLELVEVITSPERTDVPEIAARDLREGQPGHHRRCGVATLGKRLREAGDDGSGRSGPRRGRDAGALDGALCRHGQLESLEPYLAKWPETATLTQRTLDFARAVNQKAYMVPYGFYIRALFYNKKLFEQAGIGGPPATMADFRDDAQKIAKLPGKYGYCLRGAKGGFNGWYMFMAAMNGKGDWFEKDGSSTFNEPGAVKGVQFMVDLYKDKLAPPDSVNWGFNEVVAGFYSGTCAMLDQDPDALIGIKDRMDAADFAVAPMPLGPSGKAFPTIGYAGWSMFANSQHKDESWKLISFLTSGPQAISAGPSSWASSRSTRVPRATRHSGVTTSPAGSPS